MSYQLRPRDIIVCYDESDFSTSPEKRNNEGIQPRKEDDLRTCSKNVDEETIVPCNVTDVSTYPENANLNIVSHKFSAKAARKYPLNTFSNFEVPFLNYSSSSSRESFSDTFFAEDYFEELFKPDAVNCKIYYNSNYNLKKSQTDFVCKCFVTKSDIAKYASYLPHMTIQSRTSTQSDKLIDKSKDFFDEATMEHVRHNLFQLSSLAGIVTGGPPSAITFHSSVKARRVGPGGKINFLLQWSPADMVPDTWVADDELFLNLEKTIPVSQLPHEALQQQPVMNVLESTGILPRPGKRKRK